MHANPSLIIALLAVFVWPGDVHAAPDELEQYLAGVSGCVVNMDVTDADAYFDGKAMMPVEGIWRMSGSEGLFAAVRGGRRQFQLAVPCQPGRFRPHASYLRKEARCRASAKKLPKGTPWKGFLWTLPETKGTAVPLAPWGCPTRTCDQSGVVTYF